jgi:hypothetical protein
MHLAPTHIPQFHMYDAFYNCDNEIVLIFAHEIINPMVISFKDLKFTCIRCSLKKTYVYKLAYPQYEEFIDIKINGKLFKNQKINRYPDLKDKIIMSTIVKNENNYIKQWIYFYKKIGVDHFIIYDNETTNNSLGELLHL